jgi:hypothetical protein
MLCIVYGTFFSTAVIVAENILRFQFIGIDQPTQQPESRLEEAKEPQSERNREEGKGTIIDTQA